MEDILKIKGASSASVNASIPCASTEERVRLLGGLETIRVHQGLPSLALAGIFLLELYENISDQELLDKVRKVVHKGAPEKKPERHHSRAEESSKLKRERSDKDKEKEKAEDSDRKADREKEKADKEKADKEKADKEKADKEKAEKEKEEKEKAEKEKEKAEKERAEKADKEKSEKEKGEKAEKEKTEKKPSRRATTTASSTISGSAIAAIAAAAASYGSPSTSPSASPSSSPAPHKQHAHPSFHLTLSPIRGSGDATSDASFSSPPAHAPLATSPASPRSSSTALPARDVVSPRTMKGRSVSAAPTPTGLPPSSPFASPASPRAAPSLAQTPEEIQAEMEARAAEMRQMLEAKRTAPANAPVSPRGAVASPRTKTAKPQTKFALSLTKSTGNAEEDQALQAIAGTVSSAEPEDAFTSALDAPMQVKLFKKWLEKQRVDSRLVTNVRFLAAVHKLKRKPPGELAEMISKISSKFIGTDGDAPLICEPSRILSFRRIHALFSAPSPHAYDEIYASVFQVVLPQWSRFAQAMLERFNEGTPVSPRHVEQ